MESEEITVIDGDDGGFASLGKPRLLQLVQQQIEQLRRRHLPEIGENPTEMALTRKDSHQLETILARVSQGLDNLTLGGNEGIKRITRIEKKNYIKRVP